MELLYQSEFYSFYIFIVGFLTAVVGAMGGGGGLILIPFMIMTGLSPQLAIGTTKLSSLGIWASCIYRFHKEKKVNWRYVLPLTAVAVVGGYIGTSVVINVEERYIYPIIGIILLIVSPLSLAKRDFGLIQRNTSKQKKLAGYLTYLIITIYGGFFGGGAGAFVILALVYFFGMGALEAHATDTVPWSALAVISSILFAIHGHINYELALILFISMILGGWVGSHIAVKGGDKLIKMFVCLFAIAMGIKLLLDSF